MQENLKKPLFSVGIFLCISLLLALFHWVLGDKFGIVLQPKIHFMLFFLSLVVVLTISAMCFFEQRDKIGFVYLGFVLFKMFGIGYLAVFEKDFKLHLLPYFALFWLYLATEAVLVLRMLPKDDINHIKKTEEG